MQIKIEKIVSGNRKIAPKNDFSRSLHLLPIGKVAATSWSCRVNFYDSFTTQLRVLILPAVPEWCRFSLRGE